MPAHSPTTDYGAGHMSTRVSGGLVKKIKTADLSSLAGLTRRPSPKRGTMPRTKVLANHIVVQFDCNWRCKSQFSFDTYRS